jgi:hypothetical protein
MNPRRVSIWAALPGGGPACEVLGDVPLLGAIAEDVPETEVVGSSDVVVSRAVVETATEPVGLSEPQPTRTRRTTRSAIDKPVSSPFNRNVAGLASLPVPLLPVRSHVVLGPTAKILYMKWGQYVQPSTPPQTVSIWAGDVVVYDWAAMRGAIMFQSRSARDTTQTAGHPVVWWMLTPRRAIT